MKKLSIICTVAFVLGFTAGPAFTVEYCKDLLKLGTPPPAGCSDSLETFKEAWTISTSGAVDVDVEFYHC